LRTIFFVVFLSLAIHFTICHALKFYRQLRWKFQAATISKACVFSFPWNFDKDDFAKVPKAIKATPAAIATSEFNDSNAFLF
jgi:hypothetical protein